MHLKMRRNSYNIIEKERIFEKFSRRYSLIRHPFDENM